MFITALIIAVVVFVLYHNGYLQNTEGRPLIFPLLGITMLSLLIGTVLSLFVGHRILCPIVKISEASKEVAKGNFNVRIPNKYKLKELRDLSDNFNIMVKELSGIETLRSDFVVNVSHEFKTPISAIEGYATLLSDRNISEQDHKKYVDRIIESSRQLSTLSGNILSLSKLENQEVISDKKIYRLDEQIRQSILFLESEWTAKNIELDINLQKQDYFGNSELMFTVWTNILGNAIKFCDLNGIIEISLTGDSKNIKVEVKDNGIGISEDAIAHVFDKFYQEDSARKAHGNGLGLALVKRIIDLCGGTIKLYSENKKGTTVVVILPEQRRSK